ncbi:hypothetical protein HYG81_10420 [Natrinema zhouii]|uniref:Uncharacterized protein n=1 Tax=Natrinema zhouii TaxID=1710539 RepID=A0A7D6CMY3_9EURY|nr:hypothetical protein [Natrinema zhouii]QLK24310.1 hypothetical protein HYG81_10420 [Natrinema zhouii]
MAPSVELTETTNGRLEELQAEIRRETGRTVPKSMVFEQIIRDASESKDEAIELFVTIWSRNRTVSARLRNKHVSPQENATETRASPGSN